ncbi:Rid family hydrolase [Chloroflexota bacterium]
MDWKMKKYPMYYGGVKQVYPNIKPGSPFFSKSVVVGNLIFLSGSAGRSLDTGDVPSDNFEEQMLVSLDKIKIALEETESSLNNLVKTFILLRHQHHYALMWKIMLEYYQKHAPLLGEDPPASTVVRIDSLADVSTSPYLIEIEAIAVVSPDEPGWELKKYPLYSGGKKQVYPNIEPGMPFLSETVAVGNLLFLSGVTGENPETGTVTSNVMQEQLVVALDKVRTAMEKTGSTMSNIVKTLHFLTCMDLPATQIKDKGPRPATATGRMWKTELEYFEINAPFLLDEPPASTFMQCHSLGKPECLVGIDVIGVINRDRPGWEVKKYPLYYGQRGFPLHLGDTKKYYADSVVVGNLLFFSGKSAKSPYTDRIETNDFKEQVVLALDKLRQALEEAGSSMENLVENVMLVKHLEHYSLLRKTELEYYQKYAPALVDEPPAGIFIKPVSLAIPEYLIEIDSIGYIPDSPH